MAYQYQTGTANHLIHWFTLLETFLTTVGWTIESGGGTQEIVFSSIGEGGGRTKLFIRFRRGAGASAGYVYHRVQDDAGGTHATTDTYHVDAPGLGAIPFQYWMAADKDKVIVNFKAGAGYTGAYVGIVEPFALSVDEEEQMVNFSLDKLHVSVTMGRILKDADGNWNQTITSGELTRGYIKDPLDNSVAVFALRVVHLALDETVGQPTDVSGRIESLPGVNPEDIITTGYAGATSTWIVMGTGTHRWCMRTGGNVPVGQLEGAHYAHTNGLATSVADFESKLLAFMTAVGWTKIANPAPVYPVDYFWYSQGESGIDDIYLRWTRHSFPSDFYYYSVSDDTALTHETTAAYIDIADADFPTYYYITADRDCLLVVIEKAGQFLYIWMGMYQLFMPDPDSYGTPYKVGTRVRILRDHAGSWNQGIQTDTDGYLNSSPNQFDGVTNIVWQYFARQNNDCPIGVLKYLMRLSGPSVSLMDAVAIGGRSFRYFWDATVGDLAFREA